MLFSVASAAQSHEVVFPVVDRMPIVAHANRFNVGNVAVRFAAAKTVAVFQIDKKCPAYVSSQVILAILERYLHLETPLDYEFDKLASKLLGNGVD